jgi:hypothetical protein
MVQKQVPNSNSIMSSVRIEPDPRRRVFRKGTTRAAPFRCPDFNEAGRRDVAVLLTNVVRFPQPGGERPIVFAQLGQHIQGSYVVGFFRRRFAQCRRRPAALCR